MATTEITEPLALDKTLQRVANALEAQVQDSTLVWDSTAGAYTNESVKQWLAKGNNGLIYGAHKPASTSTAVTKLAANAGIAAPTPGVIGTPAEDPYTGLGPFRHYRANGYVDADDTPHCTGIEGDTHFDPAENQWELRPTCYRREDESDGYKVWRTDTALTGFTVEDAGIDANGGTKPFILAPAYGGSLDSDGYMQTKTGMRLAIRNVSHNTLITQCRTASTGYSAFNTADYQYISDMFLLKYGTSNSQSVFAGCTNYNYQYSPAVASGDQTIIVTAAQAANLLVGSTFSLGTNTGTSTDRNVAQTYDVFDRCRLTSKVTLSSGNVALSFDTTVDISANTTSWILSTMPWHTGATDAVEGDGSPYSNTSGKEPFKLQGIELGYGAYEIVGNVILNGKSVYSNSDSKNEATSLTSAYADTGVDLLTTEGESTWAAHYGLTLTEGDGFMTPAVAGGSTTTGMCDQTWSYDSASGAYELPVFGLLWSGASAGLWCSRGGDGLSVASWGIGSRLSANGRRG